MQMRKDNTFVLFKNDRKESGNQPDYTGHAQVGGQQMDLAAWIRQSEKSGKKYLSGKFSPKREQQQAAPQQSAPAPADDDIPF